MNIKKSLARRIFEVCNACFMIFMVVITLYPVLYVVFASLSDSDALIRLGGKMLWHPVGFNIDAYQRALSTPNIINGYKNTLFLVIVGTIISMVMSIIGAYFMVCKRVFFQRAFAIFVMITMWFSGGIVPFYVAVRDVNLVNSLWSLIIPLAINTYNMIILRTGFAAVPESLHESAFLDGAGHIRILYSVMIPLSKATIAVVALYYGVAYWNQWFQASIFLQGATEKWPLQLVLRQILIVNDSNSMMQDIGIADQEKIGESIKYAVIIIATVPVLVIYPFIQKYFVKGVMIGAVKG